MHDGKKVLECLRKAGKVATECLDPGVQAQLIVELINTYIHFYHQGNQLVSEMNDSIKFIILIEPFWFCRLRSHTSMNC